MVKYNTELPDLKMREYGRHIQKLVDHCVSIEDRTDRTKCAYSIAEILSRLFPEQNGEDINNKKIWDHLNMIAGFKLDIDYPCEVINENDASTTPSKIPYSNKSDNYRCYGNNIIKMIHEISSMEGGVEKDNLIFLVANQMKKLLVNVNADSATDHRVFKDIRDISRGAIDIDATTYKLNDYIGISNPKEQKKKKKK